MIHNSEAEKIDYNSYHYIDVAKINTNIKTEEIFNHYHGYNENEGWWWTQVRYSLTSDNNIWIDFLIYSRAHNGWNLMNTWAKTWLKVNQLIFNTSFSFNDMKSNLTRELNKGINYYSNIDNNSTKC